VSFHVSGSRMLAGQGTSDMRMESFLSLDEQTVLLKSLGNVRAILSASIYLSAATNKVVQVEFFSGSLSIQAGQ
jgi:hypothetical protein